MDISNAGAALGASAPLENIVSLNLPEQVVLVISSAGKSPVKHLTRELSTTIEVAELLFAIVKAVSPSLSTSTFSIQV